MKQQKCTKAKNFSKDNHRHQTTDPERSDNIKKDKHKAKEKQNKLHKYMGKEGKCQRKISE